MPIFGILSPFVDFVVSMAIPVVMMAYDEFVPTWNIMFLPFYVIFALATSTGVGLWLSEIKIKYRDFQYTVPFLIQI